MTDDLTPEQYANLNWENFPCGSLPETHAQMNRALPCPLCRSEDLLPVSDCQTPPTLAIGCEQCGEIEGNAPTLAEAVTSWNGIERAT